MRTTLREHMDLAQSTLHEEGSMALRMLRAAITAVQQSDVELADEVIAYDDQVDERYLEVEVLVEQLFALQAPAATDMRLVLAISKINLHLERISDYCVTIAKMTKLSAGLQVDMRLVGWLEEMGTRAEEMTRVALEAFADRDLEAAESLLGLDQMINRTNRRSLEWVAQLSSDPEALEWAIRMLLVSRCLERIGDHAVDIGEQTAYLVTGEFREFTDATPRNDEE